MLPKRERLTTSVFNHIFPSGRRYHSPSLQLIHAPSPAFHAAAVVGKKVAKTAVARNALRRTLYALLRDTRTRGEISNGVYIVIAKSPARDADSDVLAAELATLVGRASK